MLADSGPLYAIADETDVHHGRAIRESQLLLRERREILIAYPILLEAYSLALSRLGRSSAFAWLSQIVSATFVDPMPEDYRSAIAQVRSLPDQSVTLVDATLAALAGRLDIPVWTYDHHFEVMRTSVWR